MNCPYCHVQNDSDSHRCCRCGRRLNDERVLFPVQTSSAAPVVEVLPEQAPRTQVAPPSGPQLVRDLPRTIPTSPEIVEPGKPVQASLFGPMEVVRQASARTTRASSSSRRRSDRSAQQQFDFTTHALPTSVEAAVACNAPVAPAAQRSIAAVIDTVIPLMGFAVFVGTLRLLGEFDITSAQSMALYGAALGCIALFYRVMCCVGDMDTIGTQWAGLQLLNFHGQRPRRTERFRRLAGGMVSSVALGIGLIWALADEERLTWHDYISNTFPTPRFRN